MIKISGAMKKLAKAVGWSIEVSEGYVRIEDKNLEIQALYYIKGQTLLKMAGQPYFPEFLEDINDLKEYLK